MDPGECDLRPSVGRTKAQFEATLIYVIECQHVVIPAERVDPRAGARIHE